MEALIVYSVQMNPSNQSRHYEGINVTFIFDLHASSLTEYEEGERYI